MDTSKFVVIDFETATAYRSSACALGATKVVDGEIVDSRLWLIRPEPLEFDSFNSALHGITAETVKDSPTFGEAWGEISAFIKDCVIVAHNASFDISVLRRTAELYDIVLPEIVFLCTYRLSEILYPQLESHCLNDLATMHEITLEHHNALSDSIACAKLLLAMVKQYEAENFRTLAEDAGIEFGFLYGEEYQPCRRPHLSCRKEAKKKIKSDVQKIPVYLDEDFCNKTYVFTGELMALTRETSTRIVQAGGGYVRNTVNSKTDIVVLGALPAVGSSKLRKAREMIAAGAKIKIIDEAEFMRRIDDELYHICFGTKEVV